MISTSNGNYWSRTADGDTYSYRLVFYSGYVNPQSSTIRGYGLPVRCVEEKETLLPFLASVLPNSKLLALPLEFGYTGIYSRTNGYLSSEGSNGYYWSRTNWLINQAFSLQFTDSYVYPSQVDGRGFGRAVR